MAYTYSKISTYTVGSGGVATMAFLNIPQTYTDLLLKASTRDNRSASVDSEMYIRFNGSTANGSARYLYGSGASVASASSGGNIPLLVVSSSATANIFSNNEIYIPNYASNNYKSLSIDSVSESNITSSVYMFLTAGLWSDTSPITSISITPFGSNSFVQYSTFHLYGIKAEV